MVVAKKSLMKPTESGAGGLPGPAGAAASTAISIYPSWQGWIQFVHSKSRVAHKSVGYLRKEKSVTSADSTSLFPPPSRQLSTVLRVFLKDPSYMFPVVCLIFFFLPSHFYPVSPPPLEIVFSNCAGNSKQPRKGVEGESASHPLSTHDR